MDSREPVAIIGMACRFAGGVSSPDGFWTLLREGGTTSGDLPEGRWDWYSAQGPDHAAAVRDTPGRGSYLDDVAGFDADFFGITPREAALMDPQQRIILELSWEALEHAGVPPHTLAGTDAGVFMGVGADDYGRRLLEDLPRIEAWSGIGGAYCAVSNRVSHVLDLRGSSMSVDTACSSSLVAVHLAAQALRAGECPVALAGGVLVVAAPGLTRVLSAAGAISPDGRSKSFQADADGYGRGEGGGVVVLKLLSDARRDGDRVLAVLRGSAVHQDGRTNGIMAPDAAAQAHLLRRTYAGAGIDPASVSFVEAHGTGTRVGDPLEAAALAEVFGADRPAGRPLLIGSAKPNVGHLEAGAGMAGLIKAVLALRHREIPPNPGFTEPNPAIPWDTAGLRVVDEPTPWPDGDGPRRAGVSGYGYGGTIAHVILEEAEEEPVHDAADADADAAPDAGDLRLYPVSAASAETLARRAADLADHVESPSSGSLRDLGHTLALRRTHLSHRAAVVASGRAELAAGLRAPAVTGTAGSAGHGLVWVFSGHGSQWVGMAARTLADDPDFAAVLRELDPVFREEIGFAPTEVIERGLPLPVDVAQPMIYAVQVALAASCRAAGIRPDAVVGHSVGEIAAAVTAGALTEEQGARLVCRRSLLLRRVAGQGAMIMVALPPEEVEGLLGDRADLAVAVAAAPRSTVVSGVPAAVEDLAGRLRADGVAVREVDSDVAFHSPSMDPLLADLEAAASDLTPRAPEIPLYTTALDDPRSTAPRDGAYWAANLRGTVRFAHAIAAAAEDGHRTFLEVAPHPVVEHSINETLEGADGLCTAHTMRRSRPERRTLLESIAVLYAHGAPVDWRALWPEGRPADLPPAPWRHRPYWIEEDGAAAVARVAERHDPVSHTLLGGRTSVHGSTPATVWLTSLDRETRPYPGDHPVREVEIVPAAVLLNTFLTAASSAGGRPDLTGVHLHVPVTLTRPREVQIVLQDGMLRLSSRIVDSTPDDRAWVTHTTATAETRSEPLAASAAAPPPAPGTEPPPGHGTELPSAYVVDRLATLGVAAMGFHWELPRILREDGRLAVTVQVGTGEDAPSTWAPLLDAALSAASVAFSGDPVLRMPAHVHRVALDGASPARALVLVRVTGEDTVDVEIRDTAGTVVARLDRLRYGVLEGDTAVLTSPRRLVHELVWRPLPEPPAPGRTRVVLVGPDTALLGRISERLGAAGVPFRVAAAPEDLRDAELAGGHTVVVVPPLGPSSDTDEAAVGAAWLLARTARRLADSGLAAPARLWCATQGVRESDEERSLGHSALWGLGRIIGGEHPEFWGGVVDIGGSPRDVPALVDIVASPPGDDVVVVRDGEPSVARLRLLEGDPVRPPLTCRPDGTYLITGGLGTLGLEVARWLADRGARRLVLVGRRSLPPRDTWQDLTEPAEAARVDAILEMERLGVTVATVALDIADAEAARKLLSPAALGLPPIRGVVHAAGVLDDRTLRSLDEESLRTVMRPKVKGALVLHELFPPGTLDHFVLFSSCGQLLGLPGQAAYAAGNAFLDALAAHRRAAGDTATTSFGWTSWRGLGMSTSSAVIDAELAARGTSDISATEAFSAWWLAGRHALSYAAVLRTIPLGPGDRRPPLLSELDDAPPEPSGTAADASPWEGLDPDALHDFLVEEVRRQVAEETRLSVDDVDADRPVAEMGVDSVMTVRIRRGIERRFRVPLPATLFWDRPTVEAVARLLAELLGPGPEGTQ
ncbi:type I polyketide synthase [Actinomadura harenae]|uniref:SDR family NAD(P)-dependent oxidoreductase n=1 Tax=Actinomadura harenae TaxID=2483351 RepID=A0A3M2LTD9_9ACTN|nr:type I polyketide synthase [Actinomadura harenae]RMI40749.1 SDR family NAD(P)-dependent oxidoreductase [Actinomadura harenae]